MTKKGREFNEIFDLTAMRVIVGSVKDCYGAIGVIHSLWKPLPGRFKDWIAMPKQNMYQALHTTVIGPEGKPLEIQIRTEEMHNLAEYGIAAHVAYKEGAAGDPQKEKMTWLRQLVEAEGEQDPAEFLESLKVDLFEDEVFVFTPKGEVKNLSAGSTPLDFAYAVHTDVGHACVGAKVNGSIVPLHYQLRSGDIVEVLTAKQKRGPSRDWLKLVRTSRARNKIRAFFKEESREDAERKGREGLEEALRTRGLPMQKVAASPLLVDVIREMGFRKATEFYIALGQGKVSTKAVANKLMQRLKAGEAVEEADPLGLPGSHREDKARRTKDASNYGISVKGAENVAVRLAKCCRPVPGDEIAGYVSLGRGITIHRTDCKNMRALKRAPERFVEVSWDGENESSYRVELQIDAYDRTRLLEDLSRTFSEAGINIIGASCTTNHPMVKNTFVIEVGDTEQLKQCIARLRNVESVFDAYRITPAA
jgi:GTP pyrophosphokinase